MENNNEKKTITISLKTFIIMTIIFIIILAGSVGLYISGLLKTNKNIEKDIEEPTLEIEDELEESITLDKVLETDSIKLKYPSDWEVEKSEAYAEPTILKAPGKDDEEKAKLYITVYENTGNRTAKEMLESATRPDYGVPTKTVVEGIKNIDGIEGKYKTQSMSYDDGTSGKVTVVICVKDIYVYQLSFGGNNEEYEKYYPIFEKMLETIEIIQINDNTSVDYDKEFTEFSKTDYEIVKVYNNGRITFSVTELWKEHFNNGILEANKEYTITGVPNAGKYDIKILMYTEQTYLEPYIFITCISEDYRQRSIYSVNTIEGFKTGKFEAKHLIDGEYTINNTLIGSLIEEENGGYYYYGPEFVSTTSSIIYHVDRDMNGEISLRQYKK